MRKVDGLSLILVDFYVPRLTPRLNNTDISLQLSETIIMVLLLVFGRVESYNTTDDESASLSLLLSKIRDFPFCRLVRLAGLRWRYSTAPPHGILLVLSLSLSFMLRPVVNQPVYLGIKHPSGSYEQIFITFRQLIFVDVGRSL
jgi:hypothetical protein